MFSCLLYMVNKGYSITFLIILAYYFVRPVLPYVQYSLQKDYIVKNLCINRNNPHSCCQGKCYLNEQIKKNTDSSDADRPNNKKVIDNNNLREFLLSYSILPAPFESEFTLISNIHAPQSTDALTQIFVPPRNNPAVL